MELFSFLPDLPDPELLGIVTMPDMGTAHEITLTDLSESVSACGVPSRSIPEGLEIPDNWHHPHDDLLCRRPWEPSFHDDPDVESRTGRDVETFTPEELDRLKQLQGFGYNLTR